MGCCPSAPTAELEDLKRSNNAQLAKLEEMAREQRAAMKKTQEQNEQSMAKQQLSLDQAQKERDMLRAANERLLAQQNEAMQMAVLQQKQQEMVANTAAEEALRKAEEMKRRITPPAKPGKLNILVQTAKTFGPNAVLKRKKDAPQRSENVGDRGFFGDTGGVGGETVEAPTLQQVPVMVVREKDKKSDDGSGSAEEEYEYQYEYQYQYQYADEMPTGPKVMIAQDANIEGAVKMDTVLAEVPKGFEEVKKISPAGSIQRGAPIDVGPSSEQFSKAGSKTGAPPGDDDDYEYEYEESA